MIKYIINNKRLLLYAAISKGNVLYPNEIKARLNKTTSIIIYRFMRNCDNERNDYEYNLIIYDASTITT